MRTIERSSAFKRDYKRAKATPRHGKDVESRVSTVVALLLSDQVLPENTRDRALSGDWVGYRECHIKPDLLLIYRKPDVDTCVWRGLAHIASYSADPQRRAAFEAVARMDEPEPAPAMLKAFLRMTLRKPTSVRGELRVQRFHPPPRLASRLVVPGDGRASAARSPAPLGPTGRRRTRRGMINQKIAAKRRRRAAKG